MRRAFGPVGLVVALALGGLACSDDEGSGTGCGPVQREELDTRSVHVLPGGDAPEYTTDPPTSGPHLPGPDADPVRDEPLAAPIQVGLLEEGTVLLQHTGLTDEERTDLEALAGDGVVVAPADELPDDAAVIATAWVTKQVCGGVDLDALRTFADDYVDRGPDGHG